MPEGALKKENPPRRDRALSGWVALNNWRVSKDHGEPGVVKASGWDSAAAKSAGPEPRRMPGERGGDHDETTSISSWRPNDPRQYARERRPLARRLLLAMPPPGDPKRRSLARRRAGFDLRAHGWFAPAAGSSGPTRGGESGRPVRACPSGHEPRFNIS
jgi:hypothetical protein